MEQHCASAASHDDDQPDEPAVSAIDGLVPPEIGIHGAGEYAAMIAPALVQGVNLVLKTGPSGDRRARRLVELPGEPDQRDAEDDRQHPADHDHQDRAQQRREQQRDAEEDVERRAQHHRPDPRI